MYRTSCKASQTHQDSNLSMAHEENRYLHIQHTQAEMSFLKREARKANRRNARANVRALYPTRKAYLV